jgi:hypothetical protein
MNLVIGAEGSAQSARSSADARLDPSGTCELSFPGVLVFRTRRNRPASSAYHHLVSERPRIKIANATNAPNSLGSIALGA